MSASNRRMSPEGQLHVSHWHWFALFVGFLTAVSEAEAFAATPEGQVFCGSCRMYKDDGTPNYSDSCVQCGTMFCTINFPVCYSRGDVWPQCNRQSVYPAESRMWLTHNSDWPYP